LTEEDYVLIVIEWEIETQSIKVGHRRIILVIILIVRKPLRIILVICLY
jgi:hypothetical protein